MQYEEGFIDGFIIGSRGGKSTGVFYITKMPTFYAMPNGNYIRLYWLYPNDGSITSVQIRRKLGGYPQDLSDGTLVYLGDGIEYNDLNVTASTTYYYRIFYYDSSNNLVESFTTCNATTTNLTRYKLYFNGSNTYVSIPNDTNSILYNVFSTGNYSVIIKLKADTLSETDGNTGYYTTPVLMSLWKSSSFFNEGNCCQLGLKALDTKYLTNSVTTITHNAIIANQDTQLSVIGNNSQSNNNVKMYENGSIKANQNGMKSDISVSDNKLLIGAWYYITNSIYLHHYKGIINEIQIWNKSLSEAENLFYSEYSPIGNENGLLLYYDFSEGSGSVLHNKGSLGSACDGTIYGIVNYPPLPSSSLPYYCIFKDTDNPIRTILVFSNYKYVYESGALKPLIDTSFSFYTLSNNSWVHMSDSHDSGIFSYVSGFISSNYDVLNKPDSSVYFPQTTIAPNTWQSL